MLSTKLSTKTSRKALRTFIHSMCFAVFFAWKRHTHTMLFQQNVKFAYSLCTQLFTTFNFSLIQFIREFLCYDANTYTLLWTWLIELLFLLKSIKMNEFYICRDMPLNMIVCVYISTYTLS